jgi:hypothetical protein
MQKALQATAVALTLSLASLAAAANPAGAFLHADLGKARYGVTSKLYDGKSARAFQLGGGYRWGVAEHIALGVELGYTDLGKVKHRATGTHRYGSQTYPLNTRSEIGTRALLVGANIKWELPQNFALTGRAGIARTRTQHWSYTQAGPGSDYYRGTLVGSSRYLGVGLGYRLSEHLEVGVDVTRYASEVSGLARKGKALAARVVGLGVEVKM